ncbi:hypothetical protein KC357_g247 [Hortaea werneckii]|nr:hypothetical protein KC357_g247 [Hortaea werneckii]
MPYLRAKTQRLLPFLAKTIVAAVHMFHICSSYRALNKSDVLHDSSRSPTRMMWRAGFGRGRCDRAALLSRLSPLFLAERSRYCKSNKSTLGIQNEGLLLAGLHGDELVAQYCQQPFETCTGPTQQADKLVKGVAEGQLIPQSLVSLDALLYAKLHPRTWEDAWPASVATNSAF